MCKCDSGKLHCLVTAFICLVVDVFTVLFCIVMFCSVLHLCLFLFIQL